MMAFKLVAAACWISGYLLVLFSDHARWRRITGFALIACGFLIWLVIGAVP